MASARSSCGKDLLERTSPGSPQDLLIRACTRSCKKLLETTSRGSPQDLLLRTCARSRKDLLEDVSRIFTRSSHKDLNTRSCKDLWQDFIKIFTRTSTRPWSRSSYTTDLQDCTMKPWQDRNTKFTHLFTILPEFNGISWNQHRATTRAIGHAQTAEKVARAMSKFAPCHNESDLTRTKSREGCASTMLDFHKALRAPR